VTDSNLVLGRLDPDAFAGGAIPLAPDLSKAALATQLPGLSAQDAAFGVTEMVDENMANAARVHTVENGRDIEHFTMIGFGGGAPLHACRLCEKLGIRTLLIPPGAGVGSAIGFLKAPFSYEASRGLFQRVSRFDATAVNTVLADLEAEARAFVVAGGVTSDTRTQVTAFMRYSGQGWEIPVPLPHKTFGAADAEIILQAFEAAYRTLFGRIIDGLACEITNWSLTVSTVLPDPPKVAPHHRGAAVRAARSRTFYDAGARQMVSAQEVARDTMSPGAVVEGPAVIVERETTTLVTSAYRAVSQGDGCLRLTRKEPTS